MEEQVLTHEEKLLTRCLFHSGMETSTVLYIMAILPTHESVIMMLQHIANENQNLDQDLLYETAVRISREEEEFCKKNGIKIDL